MIDWLSLAFNFLWILGLGCILAILSWAYYYSQVRRIHFKQVLKKHSFLTGLYISGGLFCAGMAGSTKPGWELWVWVGLAILWAIQLGIEVADHQKKDGSRA